MIAGRHLGAQSTFSQTLEERQKQTCYNFYMEIISEVERGVTIPVGVGLIFNRWVQQEQVVYFNSFIRDCPLLYS